MQKSFLAVGVLPGAFTLSPWGDCPQIYRYQEAMLPTHLERALVSQIYINNVNLLRFIQMQITENPSYVLLGLSIPHLGPRLSEQMTATAKSPRYEPSCS